VTSSVLSPSQALAYLERVLEKEPRITVAGIAGPGDPFANAEETLETLRLIRARYPDLILCLASNGMNLAPHVEELEDIGVSHVTITVNAVHPETGQKIYSWVRDGKVVYRGRQAAELLLARQLHAIRKLKEHGITVKINTIVIPGVNDHHVTEVARTMQGLGADLLNCMPMFPNAGTVFADIPEPSRRALENIRLAAEEYLPQMRHCTRCRADAVGLLDDDRSDAMRGCLSACASLPQPAGPDKPYVAVASMEGVLVNQHLGEAESLQIWGETGRGGYRMMEVRPAPPPGGGPQRWMDMARLLDDCRAVLVNDLGDKPRKILAKEGIRPVLMTGCIEQGLEAVFTGRGMHALRGKIRRCSADGACAGGGTGCG
jgi:nitrogen fixation protein NifB